MNVLIKKLVDGQGETNWILFPDGNVTQPFLFISDFQWQRLIRDADKQREEETQDKGVQ